MHPMKRPNPEEDDEDLLRQEKQFLEGLKSRKVVPAAKVVKVVREGETSNLSASNVPSSSSSSTEAKTGTVIESDDDSRNAMNENEGDMEIEHQNDVVMFDVKERVFEPSKLKGFEKMDVFQTVRVPKIRVADNEDSGSASAAPAKRKKSLFAKSFDARKEAQKKEVAPKNPPVSESISSGMKQPIIQNTTFTCTPPESSSNGEVIGDKIHPLLAGMTSDDILMEQKKLLDRLDPKLVEFIRNRSQNKAPPTSSMEAMNAQSMNENQSSTNANVPCEIDENDLPIDPKAVKKFPGMQKVEKAKLAWAGLVKDIDTEAKATLLAGAGAGGKSARFDFSGILLPDTKSEDVSTYEKALHNHGEEMERPGYTIDELLTLARSTNLQQRSIALQTLGNIFSQAHTGIYDEILEKSIFNLMDYMEFIHVIRKGLDNTDSSSINSALHCLSSLLYPEHEEACFDATYLWPSGRPFPLLTTKPDEMAKGGAGDDMKDFEFLQLDLLDFLICRTEILTRVEYLISSKSELLNEMGVTSLLKILIRLARHSPNLLLSRDKLLRYIVDNHISANWVVLRNRGRALKGIPLVHALKLIRILTESSSSNAMKLYLNYRIFPALMAFLAYVQWKEQAHVEEVENLVLESFKLWVSFLDVGIGIDEYVALFPVLMQLLQFYGVSDELNSFDLHHSAHLFALFTKILYFGRNEEENLQKPHSHWDLVKDAVSLVEQHCRKILSILASPHLQEKFSSDLALLSLGKGLEFLSHSLRFIKNPECFSSLYPPLVEFCRCKKTLALLDNLKSHSVILQGSRSHGNNRYPSNFSSVGAIKWEGQLNPVMRANSPFYILTYLLRFMRLSTSAESTCAKILNSSVEEYLMKIQSIDPTSSESDYFIRFELRCLHEILSILPKTHVLKFPVAYKSLSFVPASCTNLFRDFLKECLETCCESKDFLAVYQFYKASFLPDRDFIGSADDVQHGIDEDAPMTSAIKSTKVRFEDGGHPGDGKDSDSEILFKLWSSKLVETHWVFHPLESLYKRAMATPGYVSDNISILEQETRGCLSFILHCLRHYSDSIIQNSQDLVTVYCRICRVFLLGNPNVYIDPMTLPILTEILKILVSSKVNVSSRKCIFSNKKPSISAAVSFYDFYTELVTEYFDNSYFNEVFASYLLLPLRAIEDVNVKRCFWSHELVRFVRLSEDKVIISIEYLTQDREKDPKMLALYTSLLKRKLISLEKTPFLFQVVSAHLKNSVEFMTDQLRQDFDRLAL